MKTNYPIAMCCFRKVRRLRRNLATVFVVVLLICYSAQNAECKNAQATEQVHFTAEHTSVQTPVALPAEVLAILAQVNDMQDELAHEPSKFASCFSAAAVHLADSAHVDHIVMGIGPLAGANVTSFWIFCATDRGYKMVMNAPAHDLIVRKRGHNGHRDIELDSVTAPKLSTTLLRFDGTKYAVYRSKVRDIK